MKSKPNSNKAEKEYFTNYDTDMTLKYHGSRTADTHASWFLPYLKPGMSLLDCGCGLGSITMGFAKLLEPGQVTGVDMSDLQIKRAQERAAEAKVSNIRFEVADICQLGFADNSFDALFSHDVLEHVPEPGKALQEMKRDLKPGGIIGIRDVDWGGNLSAPDDGAFERILDIYESYLKSVGGDPRIGRHLGRLLFEAGLLEVRTTASYDFWGDPEGLEFITQIRISAFADAGFVKWVTERGLAKVEELETVISTMRSWQSLPGAFAAAAHCEAIGRKAE